MKGLSLFLTPQCKINFIFIRIIRPLLTIAIYVLMQSTLIAQDIQLVQVKTFDQKLQVLKNVSISLNNKEYISVGSKGVAIVELNSNDLPIRSIKVKDDKLEAASWNFSKGALEIIIRPKSYRVIHFVVRLSDGVPVPKSSVSFLGLKTITLTTNQSGEFDLPLSFNEKITSNEQFRVKGFRVVKVDLSDQGNVILVDYPKATGVSEKKVEEKALTEDQFNDFDLSKLDSIKSLTVFYAVFKNISIPSLSKDAQTRVDAKFNQLVAMMGDSVSHNKSRIIGNISDSSFVTEDIKSLLDNVTVESEELKTNRQEFEKKILIISNKLKTEVTNLSENERKNLLTDLDLLEQLLIQNESRFYQNQNDYREIIGGLKEKFFDIQHLQTKLSNTEKERKEEQRIFRQRLIVFIGVLTVFGIMIILLITFSNRLRKKAEQLHSANEEINTINENLEAIVINRTKSLEDSNKELDTFLYRASHDLRAPIRSIQGLCSLADHVPQSELMNRVMTTTLAMDRMLRNLINISEIKEESVYLEDIQVPIMLNKYGQMCKEHDVGFSVECPADLTIHSSPRILENILTNLMENAIFFSLLKNPKKAYIEMKITKNEKSIEFSVYDNGVGIEESIQPNIYNMFFNGHEMSKGNGLGLYTVYKCVNELDGKIIIESKTGEYTKFKITLPDVSVEGV
jgi:signal transduction histidine kinase